MRNFTEEAGVIPKSWQWFRMICNKGLKSKKVEKLPKTNPKC